MSEKNGKWEEKRKVEKVKKNSCKYSMEELLPLLSKLSVRYTSGESTSITYDKARQLMGAVQYTIRIYEINQEADMQTHMSEKQQSRKQILRPNKQTAGSVIFFNEAKEEKKINSEEAYQKGKHLLQKRVEAAKDNYNKMILNFCSFGNENYKDTVEKGIPSFFLYYDAEFAPQDTIITMDYPVIGGLKSKQGILAMEEYIEKISLEQLFFSKLQMEYGYAVLRYYQSDYEEYFYNICSVIFRNLLMHMLLEEKEFPLNYGRLKSYLSQHTKKEAAFQMRKTLEELIETRYEGNQDLKYYLLEDIHEFAIELYWNYENGYVEKTFML